MPCNGVAVATAQVQMNLGEHFNNIENRRAFEAFLKAQGLSTHNWWALKGGRQGWAIGVGSAWTGVAFTGSQMEISDEGQYAAHKDEVDKAYILAQVFIGQQIQGQMIQSLTGMGLSPRDAKVKPDGSVEVRIDLSPTQANPMSVLKETARVSIALDGSLNVVTEDGAFDAGKKKVDLLLGLLGNQSGLEISGAEYETHRHDQDRVMVNLNQ